MLCVLLLVDEAWVVRKINLSTHTNRMSMGGEDRKNKIGQPKGAFDNIF